MNQVDYPHYTSYYDQPSSYHTLQPLPPHEASFSNGYSSASYTPQRWPSASVTTSVRDLRSDYPTASPPLAWSTSSSPSSTTPSYMGGPPSSNQQSTFERPLSSHSYNTTYAGLPTGGSSSNNGSTSGTLATVASPSVDVIPPSRRRLTPNSAHDTEPGAVRGHGPGSASRGNGSPGIGVGKPTGILKCSSCRTTQSPEWRKGPTGKKELCNACGLRFARSRAKKEGPLAAPPRRRKDKSDLTKRESATPPSYAPYPTTTRKGSPRRASNRGSSSHSSGEVYSTQFRHPRQNQHVLDAQLSPSPPPPDSGSSSVSLAHYASGHEQRYEAHHKAPPVFSATSNSLYPPSSPVQSATHQNYPLHSIPSPSVYHHQQQPIRPHAHHPHHTVSHPQLPPLDQIKPPHASITSSAYEHERDMREQQSPHQGQQQRMPPPPLSAGVGREGYRR